MRTATEVKSAIDQHRASCQARMSGKTALANESIRVEMQRGPLIELELEVENVTRGAGASQAELGFTVWGKIEMNSRRSWLGEAVFGPSRREWPARAYIRGVGTEGSLSELRPRDIVTIAGYATVPHENPGVLAPFVLSDSRIV